MDISKIKVGSTSYDVKDAAVREEVFFEDDSAYVDLGLPSGTLWAKYNVGASSVTDCGHYYMSGHGGAFEEEAVDLQYYYSLTDILPESVDTATQILGSDWRTPTSTLVLELINNTTFTWESNFNNSGVAGGKFTGQNGKYIFIPAGGYWSSVNYIQEKEPVMAYGLSAYLLTSSCDGYDSDVFYISSSQRFTYTTGQDCYYNVRGVRSSKVVNSKFNEKEDSLDIVNVPSVENITAELSKYYSFSNNVNTLTITLPTVTEVTKINGVIFSFTTGSTPAITISGGQGATVNYFADYIIEANKSYELNCIWNGTKWIVAYGILE